MSEARVRGLIIAVEEYGSASGLPALPGTLDRAVAFRNWLLGLAGAKEDDVLFCASPRVPGSTHDASGESILRAVVDLVKADHDDTGKLFVLHSGHGFQMQAEQREGAIDVVIGADFDPELGGFHCLRLQEIRSYLQQALGNGVHFYFVDACRVANTVLVPQLPLPPRTSKLGRSSQNSLFSAADGTPARATSVYPDAVMKALSGRGRAKTWVREQGGYWVTFPRLVDVVKQQMMTEHAEVYDEASSAPALIVPIPDVPNVSARLEVVGAKATDTFVLQLADETRLLEPLSFKGKAFGFEAPPGDYDAILRHDATTLARNEPPPGDRIAFYEGNEPHLVFVAAPRPRRGKAPRAAEPATGALFLPNVGTATAHFRVHRQGDGDVVNVIPQARSLERPPGNYKVNLMERGEQIGSATVQIGPGEDVILEPAEMLQPSAVLVAVSRRPAKGHFPSLLADDLLGQLDPAAATSVIDPNPALILALVGTAAIIDTPPYRGAVGKLETFDDLAQGSSAVYVMVDDALVGAVAVGPGQRHALDAVEGLAGARHARINVAPGPHDLHVHLDDQPDILLATHAFPGRVTLITLGAGTPPAIRQFALIPGGMVGGVTDPDALAAARFAELVQRRFGDDRVVAADLEADDQVRWEAISAGDWPEPLTAVLAGYELVRRGALANRPEAIRSLVDRLANLVGPLTDLAVLANLAAGTPPPQEGTPLVSDGVVASGARRRDGFVPNERCGWTVWQRWG